MSRKFLVPIDLSKNELQNARIQNLASAPSSPVTGQIYYDTTTNALYVYNGTAWGQAGGITSGLLSARPTASSVSSGTFYYATDNYLIYYSNGSTWQQVDNFGTGLSTTVTIAGSAADGTSTNFARADHSHAGPGFGNVTAQTSYGSTSANGSATTVAHSDHTHGTPSLSTNAASNITATTAANGSGTAPAKDDHVHGFTPANFALSAFGAPTATVSFNSQKISNLLDPTSAQDAATKNYVDATAQGLNVHDQVQAATTANLTVTYTAGTTGADGGTGVGATITNTGTLAALVIDGQTLAVGNRVLVKNQTTQTQNGIYTVTNVGSGSTAWVMTRATDADNHIAGQVVPGDFVFVAAGTVNSASGYVETASGTATNPVSGIKIGTDNIVFSQFSGAGTYTASNGVLLTGNNFTFAPTSTGGLQTAAGGASILLATNSGLGTTSSGLAVGAGTGISVTTGTVAIDTTVVVRKYAANVGDGSSTSITVTHSLNTKDVTVAVYDNTTPYAEVMCDVQHTSTSAITLLFSTAPTSGQYRVVVQG
jgi:hypothetical protein